MICKALTKNCNIPAHPYSSKHRVVLIVLRKTGSFSEISTKNLGHFGDKGGHILDELPLIHTRNCFKTTM